MKSHGTKLLSPRSKGTDDLIEKDGWVSKTGLDEYHGL